MSDLDKNIHRKESPTPYEKIIVNPIEKDRKAKEEGYRGLKSSTRLQIMATLVTFFKKTFELLASRSKAKLLSSPQLHHTLLSFKQLLTLLAKEDVSHNPDFTQQLSELWHNLLDDCNSPSFSQETLSDKIKFFISQVQHFPPGADHTLGYYFTNYAGKDWIPFPFMELLQDLHKEYQASPPISVLQNWISLLDEILTGQ